MYPMQGDHWSMGAADSGDAGMLERFRLKIREFQRMYAQLLSTRSRASAHPELMAEYQSLVSRGGRITSAITNVIAKAEGAWDFLKSAPGATYDWMRSAVGLSGDDESGLGFIPLVLGAAALGVIALIGAWITDTLMFTRKLSAVEKLVARGIPIEEATRAVQGVSAPSRPSVTGNLSNMAMWGAFAAFAIFVLPKFLDSRKGK